MFPLAALPDGDKGHLASWNGSVRDRQSRNAYRATSRPLFAPLTQTVFHVCCRVIFHHLWSVARVPLEQRQTQEPETLRTQMTWVLFRLSAILAIFTLQLYTPTICQQIFCIHFINFFKLTLKLSFLTLLDEKNVSSLDGWEDILLVKGVIWSNFMFSFVFGVLQAVCAFIRYVKLQRLKSQTQRDILYKS